MYEELTLIEEAYDQVLLEDNLEHFDEGFNDWISAFGNFTTAWSAYLSKAMLVGGGVLLLAKVLSFGLRHGAKKLDDNVEEKEKIIDSVVGEIYSRQQAEQLKEITRKLNDGEEITDEEITELKNAQEELNEKLREKFEKQYSQGKKQKIAKALLMSSKAIDSKIGLAGSFLGGLWVFKALSETPEFQKPDTPIIDVDKGTKALTDYSRKNTELRNVVGVSPFLGI
jgi:hypothetical protein